MSRAPSQAVFLVGGRGTRLGPLTAATPKPMLAVGGKPFLQHLVEEAARHGFDEVLLLAGHLAAAFIGPYDGARILDARVRVIAEPDEAGTAGALVHAAAHLAPRFLMANGDSFFDVNLLALSGGAPLARLALRRVEDISRYGGVELDGDRVRRFAEKGGSGPGLINAGLYLLDREFR